MYSVYDTNAVYMYVVYEYYYICHGIILMSSALIILYILPYNLSISHT